MSHAHFRMWAHLSSLICLLGFTLYPVRSVSAERILRVGVVKGSQPCSYEKDGTWRGIGVDLWSQIAQKEGLAYRMQPYESIQQLLESTKRDDIDIGVECINISPERINTYRFSLPFQEDGQAVMTPADRFGIFMAFSRVGTDKGLIYLLCGLVATTVILSASIWVLEKQPEADSQSLRNRLRGFTRVYTVLATGSGAHNLTATSRGKALILIAYIIRRLSNAALVGLLTVSIAKEIQDVNKGNIKTLADLCGKKVGIKPGTVSQRLVQNINSEICLDKISEVELKEISDTASMLANRSSDAILADELQIRYSLAHVNGNSRNRVSIKEINPEMQAFAFSQSLSRDISERINMSISKMMRNGVVKELRMKAISSKDSD